ncbi:FadD3 family acyl-CoA ligase [Catenulispora pinisilvae]|uniref:FadD3 family acyl-CoA ligase n=1 Tax=Catenulispora pinisilvae TaxID=2705253 RepID=UPI001891A0F7|nr:FadD3 family acyl-CoA ligase [Catenulispora pinisilvae]
MTVQLGTTTIPDLVARAAADHGDREAVVDGEQRLTFADLASRVRQTGRAMIAWGVEPGDRVAIWAPNSAEWIVTALGAVSVGAVLVPLNTRLKAAEVGYILRKSRTKLVAVSGEFLGIDYVGQLKEIRDGLPDLETMTAFTDGGLPPVVSRRQFRAPGMKIPATAFDAAAAALTPDSPSDLFFTSGTTGAPKGVRATHGQTTRAFDQWSEIVGLHAGDRYLIANPFSHTFGYKAGILACLMRGATMVPLASFDADALFTAIERERITVFPAAPAVYQMLLAHPELAKHDLSSLRAAATGAAVIPVELIERMRDTLGLSTVITAYGLTEATGVVTMCRDEDAPEVVARTSGRAIDGVEVRTAEDTGEILVRGYNVMRGYFEDEAGTAEAIDADGWLRTGDVGELDEAGNLRITDRIKDMFICGGFNAYPAEIEQVLLTFPGVQEAAVVGVPDPRLGEVGKAFVIAVPGQRIEPEALLAYATERLANYKVPRHVELVEAFPRSSLGKVLKRELR